MQKRWFGSSEPAPGERGKPARATCLLVGILLVGPGALVRPLAYAEEVTLQAAPTPSAEFLALPQTLIELDPGLAGKPITVGDALKLKVTPPAEGELKLDVPGGETILEDQGWDLDLQGLSVTATPLKPGKRTLPSLTVTDSAGKLLARTPPLDFTITSAIKDNDPKPTEPVEIKPPLGLPFPTWAIVLIAAVALMVLAAIAYAIWRAIQDHRARSAPALPEIVRTEDEIALTGLTDLEAQGLLKKGEYKKHYFKVSELLKAYLGARYGFDAPESTTREMIERMENGKLLSDNLIDQVESLFERLDRVKFTDHVPSDDEASRLIESARKIVQQSRRVPVQPILPTPQNGGSNAVR